MGKGRGWARLCLMGLGLFVVLAPVWAQTVTPEDEYKKLIRVSQNIQPLGEHLFGANIGLYNGSLSFEQTDVSLAGKGPLLQLTREFSLRGRDYMLGRDESSAFGDWELDLPRITTMTANQTNVTGWQVRSSGNNQRCSDFDVPPSVAPPTGDSGRADWLPATWWQGYHMVIPGQGSQDLLANIASDKSAYPAVTKNHWRISCIQETTTANGEPGDGFIAQAPDGTRYWFNELVYRWAPNLERPIDSGPITDRRAPNAHPTSLLASHRATLGRLLGWLTGSAPAKALPVNDFLRRREGRMLVTRIEDRFGNALTYHYDAAGKLTSIIADDGRKLIVEYVSGTERIQRVTLQSSSGGPSREWNYAYTGDSTYHMQLASVTLPDGRQWRFDFDAFDNDASLYVPGSGSCNTVGEPSAIDSTWTATITHPSGLTGSFTIKPLKHGRSNVWRECLGTSYTPDYPGSYAAQPKAWYSFTIASKILSGAGIPTETWHYSYSPANDSWTTECSGGCASTVWTTVLNPDGSSVKYTFSNRNDYTESQLQKTEFYSGDGTGLMRTELDSYAAPTGQAWPTYAGDNLQSRINSAQTEQRSPENKRQIVQNGDTYTWQAEAFNTYAQVTKAKRFNTIAGQTSLEESTTYLNDTINWVLGLPETITNVTNGEVINQYFYYSPTSATPDILQTRYHFCSKTKTGCLPVMSYTWDATGQLTSFTDANTHTTTLSNYKHGIPQTIGYPDGTSQSLVVDDLGQITSITNQAGHATQYTYDAAGRLTGITYPSGWNPKTFAYDYVTGVERGIGGGHWRRTVSQGNARHVTYFDALLRPLLSDTYIYGNTNSHISSRTAYNWKGLTAFASWSVAGSPTLSAITAGTTTTYDALGRVTAISQPSELGTLTTTTAYLSGARKQVTDPAGHVTTTSYQVFDTPSYKAVTQVTAPEDIVQTITRNLYGVPTTITQSGSGTPSIVKHLYYDKQHRLCRTEEPETGSTLMGYDAAGNLVWSAEGQAVSGSDCGSAPTSSRTTRTYDAMNRLTTVSYPDTQGEISTTYDALGRVNTTQTSTVSGPVLWTDAYDTLGHLTSETLAIDGHSWPICYAYDHNGVVSEITYPDGKRVAYAPDALGRPTKAGAYVTGVSYYPDGTLKHYVLADGTDYLVHKSPRHLVDNLTYGTGSILTISQDYTYDKNANLTSVDDLVGQNDKTLSYDALNRLTEANAPNLWGIATYGYDALNNLSHLTGNTYHYVGNRLTSITQGGVIVHSFAYDPYGNVVQMDSQSRVFDDAHRLLSIPGVASYVYDAAGRRVKATDAGGHKTYYAYNSAGHLMYRWDAATGGTSDYVYLGKKLVARVDRAEGDAVLNAPDVSIDANPNNGSFTVNWSTTQGASYLLQEQVNGGSWHAAYSGTATHEAESGKVGGRYRYRVRACQGDCSDWGLSAVVGVTPAKPAVTVPSGYQHGTYTIHWTRPTGTTDVDVQEQFNGGSWKTLASHTTATSLDRPGATDGSYTYRVRANNAAGTRGWSDTSDTVAVLHPPAVAPSLSVPSTTTTGSYIVSWGSVSGASSYTLQQQVNGGSWSNQLTGSARSKAYSGKTNGAHYGYQVKACNVVGCGPWSVAKTIAIAIPPPEPVGVYANERQPKSNLAFLTIVWQSVDGASQYQVKDVRTGITVLTTTGISYDADSGDPPLTMDGFAVRSCNAWACSDWVNATRRQVLDPPPQAPSLSAPSGNASGSYTVSWGIVFHATSYTLQERVNSGSWHEAYSGSGRSKAFSGKADGSYGYRAQACNNSGCSAWSSTKTVMIAKPPTTPTGLTVYVSGPSYKPVVHVSWNAVAHATYYRMEETLPGQNPQDMNMGTATSTSGLEMVSGQITYRVRACNAAGCSPWSGYRSVMVMAGGGFGGLPLSTQKTSSDSTTSAPAVDQQGEGS